MNTHVDSNQNKNAIDEIDIHELSERYQFARSTVSSFVSWFTFFGTLNLVALGWLISLAADPEKSLSFILSLSMSVIFSAQNVLAYFATLEMRDYIG